MKIYDISQAVPTCVVYDGDTAPELRAVKRMSEGDTYNLTDLLMCAHNGTHVDAPYHFLADGKTVGELSLEKTVGSCTVIAAEGTLVEEDAVRILEQAGKGEAAKRILLKGEAIVAEGAAEVFARSGVSLIGVEPQSVAGTVAPANVHKILLSAEIVLLEGIRLVDVEEGEYFLFSAPINLGDTDGAPCRAVLIEGI